MEKILSFKKPYSMPECEVIELKSEGVMALSSLPDYSDGGEM